MQIVECPRDAMQGIDTFIPTQIKINYLNKLLRIGFHTLDFGSFVSPKSIPQLRDTKEVLQGLELDNTDTKLLAIIANIRGAKEALTYSEISYLGYPLSISETFQQRNTNKSIASALEDVSQINELCIENDKKLVTYISMGFGNPYNEPYSVEILMQFTDILSTLGIQIISLSDTIGVAEPNTINEVFYSLSKKYPEVTFGVHLHSTPETSSEKIQSALNAGCKRFDGAILGYGGCPMAEDEMVGNMNTRTIISKIHDIGTIDLALDMDAFSEAEQYASNEVFGKYK